MEDLVISLDNKALKVSVNKVIKSVSEDLIDLRNSTPRIVANKLLELAKSLVPVYTSTLKDSGKVESKAGRGGGTSLIFDATKGQQEKAQKRIFKYARYPLGKDEDPNESYAEAVEFDTGFLTGAVDLYNHGDKPIYKLKNSGKPIYLEIPLEIKYYGGYINRKQVRAAKKLAEMVYDKENNPRSIYDEEDIQRAKQSYNTRFNRKKSDKKIYGKRSK